MKIVNALVDYDNFLDKEERTANEMEFNLERLFSQVSHKIKRVIPDAEEAAYRLYGGWVHLDRQYSDRATWLLSLISRFRGSRMGGVRTRVSMALSIIADADLMLIGTYRNKAQKMVDTMISADLIRLSHDTTTSLVLVSDDDDFVPGLLESATRRPKLQPVFAFRRNKRRGEGPNDKNLACRNIHVEEL